MEESFGKDRNVCVLKGDWGGAGAGAGWGRGVEE